MGVLSMRTDAAGQYTGATRAVLLCPDRADACSPVMVQAAIDTTPDDVEVIVADRGPFATALDAALGAGGRAGLAVLVGDWTLAPGWLEGLERAATSDDIVVGSVPLVIDLPSAGDSSLPAVLPRICPDLPRCVYLRRSQLALLGSPDPALSDPVAVLADLVGRSLAAGLTWTLADDVTLAPAGEQATAAALSAADAAELARRYPWLQAAREDTLTPDVGSLRRALSSARVRSRGLTVTIDARNLDASVGGTQTYTASLISALAESGADRAGGPLAVRAVVGDDAAAAAARTLFAGREVEVISYEQAVSGVALTDVVHRPQQVFTPADLALMTLLGERLVITHLDLISYRSPAYHRTPEDWRHYRRTTRIALSLADRVVFLSEHARQDALAEDLIHPGRTDVVGIAVEHAVAGPATRPDRVPSRPFVLMLGADYVHKNRVFAIELVAELRALGWDGVLVFAGRHVLHASSAEAEAARLEAAPELRDQVVDLGSVSESEKRWLLSGAAAVLCVSSYEGFGLTPLEAAAAGVPCIYAATTSLTEVVGSGAATVVPWDPLTSAAAALPLLAPGPAREQHLALLAGALARCSAGGMAEQLTRAYHAAVASPFRSGTTRTLEALDRERVVAHLDAVYRDLSERTEHGLPLIDRDGLLSEAEQRGLMRIAARRWLRTGVLGPVGLLGRLADRDRPA